MKKTENEELYEIMQRHIASMSEELKSKGYEFPHMALQCDAGDEIIFVMRSKEKGPIK